MLDEPRRLILRAELHHADGVLVTHTLAVTSARLTLACARPLHEGQDVRVCLSFPGLVDVFEVTARVQSTKPSDGHGHPATAVFAIEDATSEARATLDGLVALRSLPPPAPRKSGTVYRCLLVEDNAFVRDMFSFAIEKYGADRGASIAMDAASSAEDAWRMVEENRYDIALVDHFLPGETGAKLIARMRADARHAATPVVAISTGGDVARDATFDAGANMFLDKPLAMKDLVSTLDKLTRRRS